MTAYAELHCHSNFSFLDGASHPEDVVAQATELGLAAVSLTDHNGLYGAVRFCQAARDAGLRAITGAEMTLNGGAHLTLLVKDERGYANLCRLISRAQLDHTKGKAELAWDVLQEHAAGLLALSGCASGEIPQALGCGDEASALEIAARYRELFGAEGFWLELQNHLLKEESYRNVALVRLAEQTGLGYVATNDVHYTHTTKSKLADVLVCIREHTSLDRAGLLLRPNAEFHLKNGEQMAVLFADYPGAVERTLEVAALCRFDLNAMAYPLPQFALPPNETPFSYLYQLVQRGVRDRYHPITPVVARQVQSELDIIEKLGLAPYFLVVWDIVRFCREQGILAQGRGSAANSAACFALGITNVDPIKLNLLFERFLSDGRAGPPDIDIDVANNRREEVIQYVYEKYGREYAGMVCEVITYRARSAVRDVGKALGLPLVQVDQLAKQLDTHRARDVGADAANPEVAMLGESETARTLFELCREIDGFPRHLGIHVGGMVMTGRPLIEMTPLEWATMPGRTVIQWDKDDLDTLRFVKFDILGLGMLSLVQEDIALIREHEGHEIDPARLSYAEPAVYDMICEADTVGLFQIESRAQMATLPRMRPRTFYDLVIEVAIIRPGPIQGEMVHPFLRRRRGEEPVTYLHPLLEDCMRRTLGTCLFQEQGMRVAMVAAGFSASQADQLRKAMGHKRSQEQMERLREDLLCGMERNGIGRDIGIRIYKQLAAFAEYGFPESHAASFALIVYISAHLKLHHPAAFYCALLNCQPMGFYQPAVIVNDAHRHDIAVLPVDVNESRSACTLIDPTTIRLGFRYVRGIGEASYADLDAEAERGRYASVADFCRRTRLSRTGLEGLAAAGAFDSLGCARRDALWQIHDYERVSRLDVLPEVIESAYEVATFATMTPAEVTAADYSYLGLSTNHQPVELFRDVLDHQHVYRACDLATLPQRLVVRVAGLVVIRQRPSTAKGVAFFTLEDETGLINLVVMPDVYKRCRNVARHAPMVIVEGLLEKQDGVMNVLARNFWPLTRAQLNVKLEARNFR